MYVGYFIHYQFSSNLSTQAAIGLLPITFTLLEAFPTISPALTLMFGV